MSDLKWKLLQIRWHWRDGDYWVEKVVTAIVWRLPHDVVKWAAIRLMVHASQGQWGNEHPDSISMMEALKRWEFPHER